MDIIQINKNNVKLLLSSQRSKIRIADSDGNHASKPTSVKNLASNYVEWMISNAEIQQLIEGSGCFLQYSTPHPDERNEEGSSEILRHFVPQDEPLDEKNSPRAQLINNYLSGEDKKKLASRIKLANSFLDKSEYATREAKKLTPIGKFDDFNIYKYEESFFSFEKVLDLNIKIRITFKMGDFTLAPHMFLLFPFNKQVIELFNCGGAVASGSNLGSGCFASWKPTSDVICAAVEALAHASEGHKRDLLAMVE